MLAVRGMYTGRTVRLLERVPGRDRTPVIVTFLDGTLAAQKQVEATEDRVVQYRAAVRRLRGAYRKSLHSTTRFSAMKKGEKALDL
jgi:hypothetical protein